MFYSYEITVDANTAETDPSYTRAKVTTGVITRVSYRPRPGHSGLCHCQVYFHDQQLFPINRGEDLHGDTFPIEWEEHIELNSSPYDLVIKAWNDDDTYSHTFDISFTILEKSATLAYTIGQVLSNILALISPRRITGGGG